MKKLIPVLAMIMLVPFVICSCFVQQAKSMKLSYEEIEFHVGDTKHISVTIEPEGADAGKISWSSSDNKIVTVDDGTITGKSKGTAVVTAESENGLKKLCNVTVLDKEIESVTLSESSTSVKQGGKIHIVVLYGNGTGCLFAVCGFAGDCYNAFAFTKNHAVAVNTCDLRIR